MGQTGKDGWPVKIRKNPWDQEEFCRKNALFSDQTLKNETFDINLTFESKPDFKPKNPPPRYEK
jgi:hypothetical protein